jgi:hypothetical protein
MPMRGSRPSRPVVTRARTALALAALIACTANLVLGLGIVPAGLEPTHEHIAVGGTQYQRALALANHRHDAQGRDLPFDGPVRVVSTTSDRLASPDPVSQPTLHGAVAALPAPPMAMAAHLVPTAEAPAAPWHAVLTPPPRDA